MNSGYTLGVMGAPMSGWIVRMNRKSFFTPIGKVVGLGNICHAWQSWEEAEEAYEEAGYGTASCVYVSIDKNTAKRTTI